MGKMRAGRKIVAVQDGVVEIEGPWVERMTDVTVHQEVLADGRVVYKRDRVAKRDATMGSLFDWDKIEEANAKSRGEKFVPGENPELTDDADEVVYLPIRTKTEKPAYKCEWCGGDIVYAHSKRFCGEFCQKQAYAARRRKDYAASKRSAQ